MVRVPTDREPTHPGVMLLQEFLLPLGTTQRDLATAIHVPFQRVNEVVRGKREVTPSTAQRLSRYFGTSPPSPAPHVEIQYNRLRIRLTKR